MSETLLGTSKIKKKKKKKKKKKVGRGDFIVTKTV